MGIHIPQREEILCPKRVRDVRDYNQGLVSFFDLDQKTVVHTMKRRVFPYFKVLLSLGLLRLWKSNVFR